MGNESSNLMIQQPLPKDYKCTSQNPNIYISIINNTQLQKHTLSITCKQDLLYEQQMFIYRKCHSDHIIAARYFQNMSLGQYCSNSYQICFYTDHPEYDLNSIQHLPFESGCRHLIDALKGFYILSQKVGWFRVNNKMIVFDKDHQIKVWFSDNFSETKIRKQRKIRTQSEFLIRIINIFDNKLSNQPTNTYQKLIEQNLKGNSIKNCTIELALNTLIMYAEQQLTTQSTHQDIHPQKQTKTNVVNNHQSKKQKSLKRNKKKSQESIPQPYTQKNTITTNHNQSYHSPNDSLALYSLSTNDHIHQRYTNNPTPQKNDFTFQQPTNPQHLQNIRLNLLGITTDRNNCKNFQSYQKNIVVQKKKFRKSMDEYQLYKIQPNVQIIQPMYIQPHKELITKQHIYHASLTPTNTQPIKTQPNQNITLRKGYQICQTKNYMKNTKTFIGDKLQSLPQKQSINLLVQSNTIKQKTSITSNLKVKDSIKAKQSTSKKQNSQTSQNMLTSYDSKKAQFDKCQTINSIVYSDIGGEEQKPSSIIINSINTTKGEQINIGTSTPSFSKYKK